MIDIAGNLPDGRIPVSLTPTRPGAGAALLVQDDLPAPAGFPAMWFHLPASGVAHALGCACCAPRNPAAAALGALFLARARGDIPWFDHVVTLLRDSRGEAAVVAALVDDVLVTARFVEATDGA